MEYVLLLHRMHIIYLYLDNFNSFMILAFQQYLYRYSGEVRDFSFTNCTDSVVPDILSFEGVVSTPDKRCYIECENGGLCYIQDNAKTCDCTGTGHTGEICDQGEVIFTYTM